MTFGFVMQAYSPTTCCAHTYRDYNKNDVAFYVGFPREREREREREDLFNFSKVFLDFFMTSLYFSSQIFSIFFSLNFLPFFLNDFFKNGGGGYL